MRPFVHEKIQDLLKKGLTDEEVEDFILAIKKEKKSADELASNTIVFWMENLQFYNKTGKKMEAPMYFDAVIDKIKAKDLLAFARKLFRTSQCDDLVFKS